MHNCILLEQRQKNRPQLQLVKLPAAVHQRTGATINSSPRPRPVLGSLTHGLPAGCCGWTPLGCVGIKGLFRKSGGNKKQRKGRREERLEQRKTPILFLSNTVPSSNFHRKRNIYPDLWFSLPVWKSKAAAHYNSYVINLCVLNSLNFLFMCFEIL